MCIQLKLDEGLRRAWITVLPEPQTTTVAAIVFEATRQRPSLGSWDWIIDIRNPHARATQDEIEGMAEAFNAVTTRLSYTIYISDDPRTYDRCALLGRKFQQRLHLVAHSVGEANSLLPLSMQSI